MMFQSHIAFALELLALAVGILILSQARKPDFTLKNAGKLAGYFIVIASVLSMLCTFYYSVRYWEDGYFKKLCGHGEVMPMCPHRMDSGSQGGGMMMPGGGMMPGGEGSGDRDNSVPRTMNPDGSR